jgi:hypothetical protein
MIMDGMKAGLLLSEAQRVGGADRPEGREVRSIIMSGSSAPAGRRS